MAYDALPDDLVTIARLLEPGEAFLLQSFLESEGIRAVPADLHMAQASPWLMHATGGVRLQVPASQVLRAKALLQARERGEFQLDEGAPDNDP